MIFLDGGKAGKMDFKENRSISCDVKKEELKEASHRETIFG